MYFQLSTTQAYFEQENTNHNNNIHKKIQDLRLNNEENKKGGKS